MGRITIGGRDFDIEDPATNGGTQTPVADVLYSGISPEIAKDIKLRISNPVADIVNGEMPSANDMLGAGVTGVLGKIIPLPIGPGDVLGIMMDEEKIDRLHAKIIAEKTEHPGFEAVTIDGLPGGRSATVYIDASGHVNHDGETTYYVLDNNGNMVENDPNVFKAGNGEDFDPSAQEANDALEARIEQEIGKVEGEVITALSNGVTPEEYWKTYGSSPDVLSSFSKSRAQDIKEILETGSPSWASEPFTEEERKEYIEDRLLDLEELVAEAETNVKVRGTPEDVQALEEIRRTQQEAQYIAQNGLPAAGNAPAAAPVAPAPSNG